MSSAFELIPHPTTPPSSIQSVTAEVNLSDGVVSITYEVHPPETLVLPDREMPWRTDRLWESTCFEMFVRPGLESAYTEFNFAPYASWNAYDFTDWRRGMVAADVPEPHIVDSRLDGLPLSEGYQLHVYLDGGVFSERAAKLNLAAVIEERDGTKSYWAIAHPPGDRPNFHHPACFAATLPPKAPE